MEYSVPNIPPWQLQRPHVNTSLTEYKKHSTDSVVFQRHINVLRDVYSNYEDIYTDGSKDDNKVAAATVTQEFNVQTRLSDQVSIFFCRIAGNSACS